MTEPKVIQKAQVSLPPPGGLSRWSIIGGTNTIGDIPLPDKRAQAAIYYEMYRQHPVVRAAVDKKAQYASAGGFTFKSVDPTVKVNDRKLVILQRFFRRSHAQKLIRLTFKDLDIYGESFWLIQRSLAETRTPMRALRLNPRFMTPIVRNGFVAGWRYGPVTGSEHAIDYNPDIILHFSLEDPENDVQGLSPLHPLQRSVAQDIFAMEYNEAFFKNSAQTGTIFIVKNSDSGEAERNRQWLEENYVGAQNAHRPILLEGEVEVEKSVSNSQEMEFLRGRQMLRQEIAMVLEVDLEKLGVHEDSNRSVSRSVDESFHAESVWPRQVILEEEINNNLIQRIFGWSDIIFDHNDKDPRRTAEQADIDDKNLKSGRETINEQRARLGLPPLPGGDEAFVLGPTGPVFVRNFSTLADMQEQTGEAIDAGALSGDGAVTNSGKQDNSRQPLTKRQAEDVSQNE